MQPKYPLTFSGLPLVYQGKTRDTFNVPNNPFLLGIYASNRLSTHNIVHQSLIALKGEILTALTVFWFTQVLTGLPNHLAAYGKQIYDYLPKGEYPADLHLRMIIARRLQIDPIEYIWRSYLTGSLWKAYQKSEDPYGLNLPPGLPLMYHFTSPIFTPTDKSETDDPRNSEAIKSSHASAWSLTRCSFTKAQIHTQARGAEEIDTKLEVGFYLLDDPIRKQVADPNEPVLADEAFTPDSSRYCLLASIKEGQDPPWLDKQLAREEAEKVWGTIPRFPLRFSLATREGLTATYLYVFELLTGLPLSEFQKQFMS